MMYDVHCLLYLSQEECFEYPCDQSDGLYIGKQCLGPTLCWWATVPLISINIRFILLVLIPWTYLLFKQSAAKVLRPSSLRCLDRQMGHAIPGAVGSNCSLECPVAGGFTLNPCLSPSLPCLQQSALECDFTGHFFPLQASSLASI